MQIYWIHDVEEPILCAFWCGCCCMYMNPQPTKTQCTHLPAQFQLFSVHSQKRRFITAAWTQHLAHQPLDFESQCDIFVFVLLIDVRVWVRERGSLLPGCVSCVWNTSAIVCLFNCDALTCVRVCVCAHTRTVLLGGICVVLFVLKVFPHSDPRGGSRRERQRERERGRESAFAVPSHPHTNNFIWKLNTFSSLDKAAFSFFHHYSSRLICL